MTTDKNEIKDISRKDADVSDRPLSRQDVRDILFSELRHFRSNVRMTWGAIGRSVVGNLFGFFLERGFGLMFRHTSLPSDSVQQNGLDYGRIFVEAENDTSRKSPSWSFDIPKYMQKLLIKSESSSLNFKTKTGNFTAGLRVTGGTSGANAKILDLLDEGATNTGTLIVTDVHGTFTTGEALTDTGTGAAALDKANIGTVNPIVRMYGVGGFQTDATHAFSRWGAFDLWCPLKLFEYTAGSGTGTADPESIPAFAQEGFMYLRNTAGTRALKVYINSGWKTVTVT